VSTLRAASIEPSSILVIYVTRIGDTMLVTPAVRALAQAWPKARIDFFGSRTSAAVFRHLPFVSRVGVLTKKRIRFKGWLQRKSYDLALVYGFDGDGPFVEYALRVSRQVIAFKQRKESLNQKLLASIDKTTIRCSNSVDYLFSLIAPLGIPKAGLHLSYVISESERQWAVARLAALRDGGAGPIVGLQIASFPTKGYRDWPVENFVELCRRIRSEHPKAHFLILGGKREWKRTRALHVSLSGCSTHYAGRLSLRQTAALMGQLDLYIGVDTGPTHIMGALHRPMVALYHPSSPSRALAPLEHPCCHVVDHPLADRGATEHTPMAGITVDAVWEKVRAALSGEFPPPLVTPWTP